MRHPPPVQGDRNCRLGLYTRAHRNLVGDVRVFESETGGEATSLVQAVHKEAYFADREPDRPRRLVLVGLVLPCPECKPAEGSGATPCRGVVKGGTWCRFHPRA